ncbi:hypothetical protein CH341_21780 [Rhodoplanes roseus]|uniref:Outer membrane protein beta-barrel domain-containing protein n=1 Tax=Rhodoplanes roseus TaxID=29409 RepID=A0A327KSN8_9BRAD|nr:hypothetical protein CH341_21780 [Rhodoplanes roseus]
MVSQSAGAADLIAKAPVAPTLVAPPAWAGFYFGGHFGGVVNAQQDALVSGSGVAGGGGAGGGGGATGGGTGGTAGNGGNGNGGALVGSFEDRRALIGLHAGYNWQFTNTVFGLEADVDSLGQGNVFGTARARLGYAFDTFLVYGTAGVAWVAERDTTIGVFAGGNGGNGGDGGSAGATPGGAGGAGGAGAGQRLVLRDGAHEAAFVIGGGVEAKLTPQVSLGVEALYYGFDGGSQFGLNDDMVTVRGRLSFHPTQTDISPAGVGLYTKAPPLPQAAVWTGVYGGVHLGALYAASGHVIDSVGLVNGGDGTAGGAGTPGGGDAGGGGGGGGGGGAAFAAFKQNLSVLGGAHLGYNWQFDRMVIGGEADFSATDDDAHKYLGTVRGRLGWTSQSYLFYATAGVAFGRNDAVRAVSGGNGGNGGAGGTGAGGVGGTGGTAGAGGSAVAIVADETQVGFVVGAGVDAKLTDRVSVGLEGLYYGFKNDDVTLPAGQWVVGDNDNSAFVLRSRLSVRLSP